MENTRKFFKENAIRFVQITAIVYLVGLGMVGISRMFLLMGEIWGWFSILWFATLGFYTFHDNLCGKYSRLEVADGLIVVILQFPIIILLTLGAGVVGEKIREVVNPLIGWSAFVGFKTVIFYIYGLDYNKRLV